MEEEIEENKRSRDREREGGGCVHDRNGSFCLSTTNESRTVTTAEFSRRNNGYYIELYKLVIQTRDLLTGLERIWGSYLSVVAFFFVKCVIEKGFNFASRIFVKFADSCFIRNIKALYRNKMDSIFVFVIC